jgi:hypothetical protein
VWAHLLFAAAVAAPVAGGTTWYTQYEKGVSLVQDGKGVEARTVLEDALRLRPEEGLRVPTDGLHYVDYLPHLYLVAACHLAGDAESARHHLADAERSGVASKSEAGARVLAGYQLLLGAAVETEKPTAAPPAGEVAKAGGGFKEYPRRPTTLSEAENKKLQQHVLARCHIPAGGAKDWPWYYYYELSAELARRGDHQRSLDALIEAVNRRPDPQHLARVYGMWFVDYLPYLQIAREHARLGNKECAADALTLSERLGESTDAERRELRELIK